MKTLRTFLSLLFVTTIFSLSTNAQFFENFELDSKAGYALGNVTLSTGSWAFDDALVRSDGSGDMKNGAQSARIRNSGAIYMNFNKTGGADELTFLTANSSFNGDGNGKIQVQYSINSGVSWINIGDEITVEDELTAVSISVGIQGEIRFKIIKTAGGRVNIDDVSISDYVVAADDATISVLVNNAISEDEGSVSFGSTLANTAITKTVQIKNTGNPNLTISDVIITGQEFSVTDLVDSTLAFNEKTEFSITFEPATDGQFTGSLTINSNAVNAAEFNLSLSGDAFADGDVIPIADARELALETRVTIAGRVTVANEFEGPLYMQDGTAGLAVFWTPLLENAEIGDSIKVSGPLTVFTAGVPGADSDFLLQISTTESDDNITYEIFNVAKKEVEPTIITVQQLNSDEFQGQLVLIQNATIDHSGAFGTNANYDITDGTGTAELRIDNSTNLVGATAPTEAVNIIGAAGKFGGIVQVLPRFVEDLSVEEVFFPGDEVSLDQTLDVVTWNIEWFGNTGNGPEDEDLQLRNAITVVKTINADIYALQEISSPARFNELVDSLEDYGGFLSNFSQTQETAYLFKRSTIDSLSGVTMSSGDGFTQSNWANGRYPLLFRFIADINGEQQEFYTYNIHAKAFGDQSSYDQRVAASAELKTYLDNNKASDNVMLLGDYNDEILTSTFTGNVSPYKNFDDDAEYTIITKNLESKGFASQSSGSFLDHITITSELSDEYFEGTERVENPSYVGSYLSTTSDHYPIWTRFKFGLITSNDDETLETPKMVTLNQNYPNPFNPSTVISYTLKSATNVTLNVYDITGRRVATLVNGRQAAGAQEISFDASSLASGVYIYRLQTATGASLTKKMVLVK